MTDTAECKNTDRELWRGPDEGNGSYYADSIHVTESGGIGIDVGGHVIVKPLRDWHAMAARPLTDELRWCEYCNSWHSKPCGEGCVWLPTCPTREQILRDIDLKQRRAHNRKHPLPVRFDGPSVSRPDGATHD